MDGAIVLDASAMLALLQSEPGAEAVATAMEDGTSILVSSVNLCEVGTKLVRDGRSSAEVVIGLAPFVKYVVDFDRSHAMLATDLYRATNASGLSLGDRACLALAEDRKAAVWTTDRAWKKLKIGVKVELLRD